MKEMGILKLVRMMKPSMCILKASITLRKFASLQMRLTNWQSHYTKTVLSLVTRLENLRLRLTCAHVRLASMKKLWRHYILGHKHLRVKKTCRAQLMISKLLLSFRPMIRTLELSLKRSRSWSKRPPSQRWVRCKPCSLRDYTMKRKHPN